MRRESSPHGNRLDALIVGAGFSGLYALHRLRELGLDVLLVERGGGVGGTWYWNRYPGARCDIESVDYQFSFSKELIDEWEWTERYAAQPEILRYLDFVADRLGLRPDIELATTVTAARYDEDADRWLVSTDRGIEYAVRFLILAIGNLSTPKRPDFPGLESFAGEWCVTARWPEEPVELAGKRVGVVGTGSTGIQVITVTAEHARELWVFQRTPNYSMPAHNGPLDPDVQREIKRTFAERRRMAEQAEAGVPFPAPEQRAYDVSDEERRRMYEAGWARGGINSLSYAFTDFHSDEAANATGAEFTREQIRRIVRDPEVAALLSPSHHIGTKRTCVDTGYYEVYNRRGSMPHGTRHRSISMAGGGCPRSSVPGLASAGRRPTSRIGRLGPGPPAACPFRSGARCSAGIGRGLPRPARPTRRASSCRWPPGAAGPQIALAWCAGSFPCRRADP